MLWLSYGDDGSSSSFHSSLMLSLIFTVTSVEGGRSSQMLAGSETGSPTSALLKVSASMSGLIDWSSCSSLICGCSWTSSSSRVGLCVTFTPYCCNEGRNFSESACVPKGHRGHLHMKFEAGTCNLQQHANTVWKVCVDWRVTGSRRRKASSS